MPSPPKTPDPRNKAGSTPQVQAAIPDGSWGAYTPPSAGRRKDDDIAPRVEGASGTSPVLPLWGGRMGADDELTRTATKKGPTTLVGGGVRPMKKVTEKVEVRLNPLHLIEEDSQRPLIHKAVQCIVCEMQIGIVAYGVCDRCERWTHWSCAQSFEANRGGDRESPYCYGCLAPDYKTHGKLAHQAYPLVLGDGGGGVCLFHRDLVRKEKELATEAYLRNLPKEEVQPREREVRVETEPATGFERVRVDHSLASELRNLDAPTTRRRGESSGIPSLFSGRLEAQGLEAPAITLTRRGEEDLGTLASSATSESGQTEDLAKPRLYTAHLEVPEAGMDGGGGNALLGRLLEAMVESNNTGRQILQSQVDAHQRMADTAERTRREARDAKFLPQEQPIKIMVRNGTELLGELIAFEKQLERHEIKGGKQLYTRLYGAIDPKIRSYIEENTRSNEGKKLLQDAIAAHKAGDGEKEYEKLYLFWRRELCRHVGADLTDFKHKAKAAWDALSLPENHTRDDVSRFLDQLMEVRTWVYMVGLRDREDPTDRQMELDELLDKVKSWSPIGHEWFVTNSQPTSFAAYESALRGWINRQKPKGPTGALPRQIIPEPKQVAQKRVGLKKATLRTPGVEAGAQWHEASQDDAVEELDRCLA